MLSAHNAGGDKPGGFRRASIRFLRRLQPRCEAPQWVTAALVTCVPRHPAMSPTVPPMMPSPVIAGTSVIGKRRANYSAIAVAVIYRRIIVIVSAVIGRSITAIVGRRITTVVTVAWPIGVRAGCDAADDGSSN
jgi:hypothetical protein